MALFKIFKGQSSNLKNKKLTEGFCYFTPDDGKFYIDTEGNGTQDAIVGTNRVPINAKKADQLGSSNIGGQYTNMYLKNGYPTQGNTFVPYEGGPFKGSIGIYTEDEGESIIGIMPNTKNAGGIFLASGDDSFGQDFKDFKGLYGVTEQEGTTIGEPLLLFDKSGNSYTKNLTVINNSFDGVGQVIGNLFGDVQGNITGNLTGNVTGNVQGNLTGNVNGNIKFTNARTLTIGNTSKTFDGSNDITFTKNDIGVLTFNQIYPVGSIYISLQNVNPYNLFGVGTWKLIENRFLLAASASHAAGTTGGAETVTLTVNQIPAHNHRSIGNDTKPFVNEDLSGSVPSGWDYADYNSSLKERQYHLTSTTGGGQAHNNMPPYLAVYMWYRES